MSSPDNNLLKAMYVVHGMLESAHDFYNQIKVGAAVVPIPSSSIEYKKMAEGQERLKRIAEEGIQFLPNSSQNHVALLILGQNKHLPGVKDMLEEVYEIYPELKEAK